MLSVEAGDVPNRQELLDQHRNHTEALQAFFVDLDRMDRVASPLRLADGLDPTSALDANGHAALATIRYFGDYELLEEIARGGMGVVYKARQVSLNRLVALKMILAGSFASTRDVQRFRSEAESAANLDHPHIVPIYEVGEHEGHQYFSMKFIEGPSLAKLPRTDPRGEVEGIITVIRAVHHAHQRGVLHRDLKSSNVLVNSKGRWLVADFGLAKRIADGDGSFTETGQVLGTPKYMAPEQAAGRKDLTVAADVYSLGVILYERLTGQTPFIGDNALTLLRQARESEPPRPSSIRKGLDRDLETVVLKCLEKEPSRRFSSAEALADDLERWTRGEPIQARPVGQAERFALWCRRNPVVSTLTAGVAASLMIGIVVSTYFAMAESRERKRATLAETNLEGAFARGVANSFDPEGKQTLSQSESESLWELARLSGTDIGIRFLHEATRDINLNGFRARSEPGLIAALGLDEAKRDRAAELLFQQLRDPKHSLIEKGDAAFIALELAERPGTLTETCVRSIVDAIGSTRRDESVIGKWFADGGPAGPNQGFGDEGRTKSRNATRMALWAAPADTLRIISQAFAHDPNGTTLGLCESLVAMSVRTKSAEPSNIFYESLVQTGNIDRCVFAKRIVVVVEHMEPADAAIAAEFLCDMLEDIILNPDDYDDDCRRSILHAMVRIKGRLPADTAGRPFSTLPTRIAKLFEVVMENGNRVESASFVASLAGSLRPIVPQGNFSPAIQAIANAIEREKDPETQGNLAWALGSFADWIGVEESARICGLAADNLIAILNNQRGC